MRSTLDLDFTKYTCGFIIDDYRTWDSTWNPTINSPEVNLPSVSTAALAVSSGVTYPRSPWIYVHEAYSFSMRSNSFYNEPN
jgi:hypothetical protein